MADDLDQMVDEEEAEEGAPWMATFADLMSLLLTFFVLLLSFATMDVIKFRDAMGSLRMAFGHEVAAQGLHSQRAASIIQHDFKEMDKMVEPPIEMRYRQMGMEKVVVNENEEVLEKISESIDRNKLESLVKAEVTGRGVVLSVEGQLFFKSGSDILKEEAYPLLDDIIGIVEEFPYKMSVEGHTDDTPINTAKFPSNWELSTGRAISTLRYIMDTGRVSSNRLGASGYADTRPIASNDTPEGRQKNRRVEFIFYRESEAP
ncbi:MAG: OmpA family protein, partial [Deltaproteobacteria bacterium]|nr:OmpA family protein [Deltaproteobacteria bacterium]